MSGSTETPLLEVRNIEAGYGASQVLFGVSLSIAPHQVVSLMGRNGMGKSTTIKCITGALPVRKGQIFFEGQEITNLPADEIARRGIALVPEGRMCFPNLTVKEHLIAFARKPDRQQETAWDLQRIYELFPRLKEREHHMGNQLSGGEQQMLAIGRALSTNPKLLILDEATEGLSPLMRNDIWKAIVKLKKTNVSILIVDKNQNSLYEFSDLMINIQKGTIFSRKMTDTTLIKHITFGQNKIIGKDNIPKSDNSIDRNIYIAQPTETQGALTIICGKNRSGKSHFLRNTYKSILRHNKNLENRDATYVCTEGSGVTHVWVRPNYGNKIFPKFFLIEKASLIAAKFTTLSLQDDGAKEKITNVIYGLNYAKKKFLEKQLIGAESFNSILSGDIHGDFYKKLDFNKVYRVCIKQCQLLKKFEEIFDCKIYLRPNQKKGFEPYLKFSNNEYLAYGSGESGWSQGQKILFSLFILIEYVKPSILLIDEIENHLHPQLISELCSVIKQNIQQSIITTHHPHLIFSSYPDIVWFFEVEKQEIDDELIDDLQSGSAKDICPPKRKILNLSSDFDKIYASYKLFDNYDKGILSLGRSIVSEQHFSLLENIENGIELNVAESTTRVNADAQSNEVANAIRKVFNKNKNKKLKILDYGAGLGRTVIELNKINKIYHQNIEWYLYEPSLEIFKELSNKFKEIDSVFVLNCIDGLKLEKSIDIVLISNVIHECTPLDIFKFFKNSTEIMTKEGSVIISELSPLMDPERFGIAYDPQSMIKIANACGYHGISSSIQLKIATFQAYTIIANHLSDANQEEAISFIVNDIWKDIQKTHTIEYGRLMKTGDVRDYLKISSHLHAIASMEAYKNKVWRGYA